MNINKSNVLQADNINPEGMEPTVDEEFCLDLISSLPWLLTSVTDVGLSNTAVLLVLCVVVIPRCPVKYGEYFPRNEEKIFLNIARSNVRLLFYR